MVLVDAAVVLFVTAGSGVKDEDENEDEEAVDRSGPMPRALRRARLRLEGGGMRG